MHIFKNPNYDFFKYAGPIVAVSGILALVGIFFVATGRLHYGIEFSQGGQIIARFQNAPNVDKVRTAIEKQSPGSTIQTYGDAKGNQLLIRIPADATNPDDLARPVDATLKALADNYAENPVIDKSAEIIGPVVGADLRKKAVQLTVFGLVFQLIYIAWRFKGPVWGGAATVAVFHDVLITVVLLVAFKYEFTLNVIAALLTLVGYSVNDTIVVFDRVRENLRQRRKEPLIKVLNDSINQTLSRTVISNGTTFLTVLGLYLFGGEVLRGFAFTMVAGIVVGTYSSIYIASPIVIWWTQLMGKRGHGTGTVAKAAL
jgi:preprotein translocase subunit SecF